LAVVLVVLASLVVLVCQEDTMHCNCYNGYHDPDVPARLGVVLLVVAQLLSVLAVLSWALLPVPWVMP
jgi:hypothetical protein